MLAYTLLPSFASSVTVFVICVLLYRTYREPYLLIWSAAWSLWVVRYAYGLATGGAYMEPNEYVLPVLVIGRSALMVWGGYALIRRRMPDVLVLVYAGAALWTVADIAFGLTWEPFGVPGLLHYLLFSASLVWAGLLFHEADFGGGPESTIGGAALIALGLLQATFPFQPIGGEAYGPAWFSLVLVVQISIGFAVVLAFTRRERREATALSDQLAAALTKALGDHLPICAHCKSIRSEDGEWTRLESYVSRRTGSSFSHGVCPSCADEHYGPELKGLDAQPGRS